MIEADVLTSPETVTNIKVPTLADSDTPVVSSSGGVPVNCMSLAATTGLALAGTLIPTVTVWRWPDARVIVSGAVSQSLIE